MSGTVLSFGFFGVPVRLHFTFVLLVIFLIFIGVGARQSGAFAALYIMALFLSVLLHEMGHSLVARRYGIRTIEIVMYPIGGMARLDRRPRAREELPIALAGPAVNLLIALGIGVWLWARGDLRPLQHLLEPTDNNLAQRVAAGNLFLAAFNMLPAYPMDGGRVLRGLLALRKSEEEATQIAASAGQALAIGMGLYGLLSANYILVFIAMFVYLGAAQEASLAKGKALTMGFPVRSAMVTDFRTLQHGETIRDAGNLLLSTSQQDFPVMLGNQVIGLLHRGSLMRSMMTDGPDTYVSAAMDREFTRLAPEADLSEAAQAMKGSCALVMEEDALLGLLTTENLAEFLVLRQVGMVHTQTRA
jgi:Zn-dependent protease